MRKINKTSISKKVKSSEELSAKDRKEIEEVVKKVVKQYGETLKLLGNS